MAWINLKNNKIHGAKSNSLTYWHEKGHILYNNSRLSLAQENFLLITIIVTAYTSVYPGIISKIFVMCSLIIYIGLYIHEELWCWYYAIVINKRRSKK